MPSGKGSKLLRYVEHRLRITLSDSRTITGTFLAFDKHLNLVLSDTEEFRTMRKGSRANVIEERQEKRNLGLIILRGENVVSIAVEGPPPPSASGRLAPGGPGIASGAGRGAIPGNGSAAPVGLGAAPVAGVGGATGSVMAPPGMGRGMGVPPPGMGRGMPGGF
mmetsp:Transcript_23581/g.29718  ORF Transcript_23581/g.29718 Transcript_23581/m.29718 type:complete len:164 (-) Transcript_23581:8-499(-)|eukprot:CAMPEP_0203688380 /NCGR_PEP_ID=MMETSP0091-20130426/1105_1 /ASSEMBLY_ACC=CAM_ASM_001089 /TAXON_ID=426623 /ORGANISM="Chaetoceros affinis, Strain CCMP159" /LENGTH=163 /DNA_ID=CAMNT_0050557877 /DNA_START=30 /DNA_END=521 /DNA_ORIENTATION=+